MYSYDVKHTTIGFPIWIAQRICTRVRDFQMIMPSSSTQRIILSCTNVRSSTVRLQLDNWTCRWAWSIQRHFHKKWCHVWLYTVLNAYPHCKYFNICLSTSVFYRHQPTLSSHLNCLFLSALSVHFVNLFVLFLKCVGRIKHQWCHAFFTNWSCL